MSINSIQLKLEYNEGLGNNLYVPFSLSEDGSEVIIFLTHSERQALSIQSHKSSSSKIHITAAYGYIYLTNKRFVFVTSSQGDINSFSINLGDMSKIQLSHRLVSPWFGANFFEFSFFSGDHGDSFPSYQWYTGRIKFNDGGLYDFIHKFDVLLHDIINNKHIDQELPRYSAQ